MNRIWFFLMILGMMIAVLTGRPDIISEVILQDAQEAVIFAISLTGIMAVWLGLMNIAQRSGLIDHIAVLLRPIIKILFPSVPTSHPASSAIVMNMVANMFGAGNSATALGIKAMEELQTLNTDKTKASNAMCMLLVINMSSIQLIPLTVLKIRADAGSQMPTEVISTSLIATTISTLVGVFCCKILEGKQND